MGISPARRRSILSASMSTQNTSLPSSAKPAAVTRPTYPVPMTAMGSRWVLMLRAEASSGTLPGPDPAQGAGDGEHLRVLERLQEGVGDPVHRSGRAPGDQPQAAPVEEQLVRAAGHAAV